jgi:hypothetical protein
MFNTRNFTGVDGRLTIPNQDAMDADTMTKFFGEGNVVGRVVNIAVSVATEIKPFHELGSRLPKELRAGNIFIAGTVERAYINGALLRLMLGQYALEEEGTDFKIPVFDISMTLDNPLYPDNNGNSVLTVYGVMFDTWQFNLPEDDFVMEKLSFKAMRVSVSDVEVPT